MDSMIIGYPAKKSGNISVDFTLEEAGSLIGELEGLYPGPVVQRLIEELESWV